MIDRAQREQLQWWAERSSRYARGTALEMKQRVIRLVAYTDALERKESRRWWQLLLVTVVVGAVLVTAALPQREHI